MFSLSQLSTKSTTGLVRHSLFLIWSFVFLYPVLVTPVVADDFAGPFYQFSTGGNSFVSALRYGLDNAIGGVNFRVVGMPIGSLFHYLHIYAAGALGIPVLISYALVKYLVLVSCAYLMSVLISQVLSLRGIDIGASKLIFITGFFFFGTLHIHGNWSNDPVVSYPYAGYGSVLFMLASLLLATRLTRQLTIWSCLFLTLALLISVFYYEISIAIVVGILPLFAYTALKVIRNAKSTALGKVKGLIYLVSPLVLPLSGVLIGREFIAKTSVNYEGTSIAVGDKFLSTYLTSLLGNLPGAAWSLSFDLVPSTKDVAQWLIPVWLILLMIVVVNTPRISMPRRPSEDSHIFILLLLSCVLTVITAVGMQSITIKIQNETPRVGFVYTHYAVGSVFVAVLLTIGAVHLIQSTSLLKVKLLSLLLVIAFSSIQWNANWRLSEHMNATLIPNRVLLSAFSGAPPVNVRCAALNTWTSGGWPDYYELGMVDGLQQAYQVFHDELFCPAFTRPFP